MNNSRRIKPYWHGDFGIDCILNTIEYRFPKGWKFLEAPISSIAWMIPRYQQCELSVLRQQYYELLSTPLIASFCDSVERRRSSEVSYHIVDIIVES